VQRILTVRSRGQALVETALALPVFLLIMFGVMWAMQTGVLGERVELVARYGGMVSAEINPYQQYSLYAAYSAAAGAPLATSCTAPPSGLLGDAAPLAAPATPTLPFWQPAANTAAAAVTCSKTLASSAALSAPMMLGHASITVNASTDVPNTLQAVAGAQTQRGATLNEFQSPDMATLVGCYGELQAAFEHSTDPASDPTPPTVTNPIAQFANGPLALSGSCGG
jgi:hypothetical protein